MTKLINLSKSFKLMKSLLKITKESEIPLIGCITFGIIDRGTNILQIRPTSICNLNCPFCSTNSGPESKLHQTEYEVELDYLLSWIKELCTFKGSGVEIHIDSVGEPFSYPKILDLIKECSKIPEVKTISIQTNGTLLTKEKIKQLEPYLTRINLSIQTLNKEKSKFLSGKENYNLEKVLEIAKEISKSKIKLLLAPVWLPNINDQDIIDLIKFTKEIKSSLGIQKYEVYKYSRKVKKAKKINFWKFYNQLAKWEKQFNIKLKLTKKDFNTFPTKRYPIVLEKNEKLSAIIKAPGWQNNQMIAIAKNRCITINNCQAKINDKVKIQITENKNNIYLAKQL